MSVDPFRRNVLYILMRHEWWDDALERIKTKEGKEELRRGGGGLMGDSLPLHDACKCGAPWELVEAMLDEYPEAAKVRGNAGRLPLHEICNRGAWELMEAMLDKYPEAAKVRGNDGRLPLHEICNRPGGADPRAMRRLIDAYPEAAKQKDMDGSLPLHYAAYWNDYSLEILNMLVDAYPEGAAVWNSQKSSFSTLVGCLPVHKIAERFSSYDKEGLEKVKALLQPILNNEEVCQVAHPSSGATPLHIAARFGLLDLHACARKRRCPTAVVLRVAKRHRDQLRRRDDDGNYPLHGFAANPDLNGARESSDKDRVADSSYEEIDPQEIHDFLRKLRNEPSHSDGGGGGGGGGGSDDDGSNEPSGNVSDDEASVDSEGKKDLISEFVKFWPEAATAMNGEGRYALSLAIESGKTWHEGVKAIANAAKNVITVRDETTNLYPFMLAATVDNPCLTTVYRLFRRCPEIKRFLFN